MPVETQGTSFGVLNHSRLVLDAEVLKGGASVESAPEERIVVEAELMLEIASWTGRLGWLRVGIVGFLAIPPLGEMALVGSLGTPAGRCYLARLATIVALALLASLLLSSRFLSRSHPLFGLLSFPVVSVDLHELLHDLKFVVVLLQPTEAMLDVLVLG